MAKEKSFMDYALDGASLALGGIPGLLAKKGYDLYQENREQELQAQLDESEHRWDVWSKFTGDLCNYRLQYRKAIMFLLNDDINAIWSAIHPADCDIVYLPYSKGLPEGISIFGELESGVLYVYDPRNEEHYYPASEISQVLIQDKFNEIKHVFECLGATQIDITFSALKDEQSTYSTNDSETVSGRYGAHKASASHSSSRSDSRHTTKFKQLEIHKQCRGTTSHINLSNCYWYNQDKIYRGEVKSIKSGATLETNFVDITQSYSAMTATKMDKIEAEYQYMETIGVSGMAKWDSSVMKDISETAVWDIHVVCAQNNNFYNHKINTMTTWQDFFDPESSEYEIIERLFNYFNENMPCDLSDDVAQSNMDCFDELLSGDDEYDSIINMFKGINGLLNEQCQEEGKRAIEKALRQNHTINFNDKYNIALVYEAQSANSLEGVENIVMRFKKHVDDWTYIPVLYSDKVSYLLDMNFLCGDDDSMPINYEALRIKTLLPGVLSAADGWNDWCDFYISDNDIRAYNCAKTAYDKYRTMKPASTYLESSVNNTITYSMMGNITIGLGRCHQLGLGVRRNDTEAFRLFEEAYDTIKRGTIERNNACKYLAECYALGTGTKVDINKAIELYREDIRNIKNANKEDFYSTTLEEYDKRIKELQGSNTSTSLAHGAAEQEYMEEYKSMLEDGEVGVRERKSLERLRNRLGISSSRATELERSVHQPALSAEEQEYLDEYREMLADGELRERDRRSLERLAHRNGISLTRASEIERMA